MLFLFPAILSNIAKDSVLNSRFNFSFKGALNRSDIFFKHTFFCEFIYVESPVVFSGNIVAHSQPFATFAGSDLSPLWGTLSVGAHTLYKKDRVPSDTVMITLLKNQPQDSER